MPVRIVGIAGSLSLGAGLLAAGPAGAAGLRPHATSGSTIGKVASVDASAGTFTVKTPSGSTVKVKVTKSTSYRDTLVHSPGFTDVKVGVSVAVIGSLSGGVETAVLVIVGGSGSSAAGGGFAGGFRGSGAFGQGTFGKVASVDAAKDTFTVKTSSGSTVKVKVTKSTTYRERGSTKASFQGVKVGAEVAVIGKTAGGVETAATVLLGLGSFRPGAFGQGTFGKVTAVDAAKDTFTVKTSSGSTVKVKVTKSTTYRERGSTKATFQDVKVGAEVGVVGKSAGGVETATTVLLGLGARPFAPPTT